MVTHRYPSRWRCPTTWLPLNFAQPTQKVLSPCKGDAPVSVGASLDKTRTFGGWSRKSLVVNDFLFPRSQQHLHGSLRLVSPRQFKFPRASRQLFKKRPSAPNLPLASLALVLLTNNQVPMHELLITDVVGVSTYPTCYPVKSGGYCTRTGGQSDVMTFDMTSGQLRPGQNPCRCPVLFPPQHPAGASTPEPAQAPSSHAGTFLVFVCPHRDPQLSTSDPSLPFQYRFPASSKRGP